MNQPTELHDPHYDLWEALLMELYWRDVEAQMPEPKGDHLTSIR